MLKPRGGLKFSFSVQSFTQDLIRFTKEHSKLRCYGLGLGLDSFRMVALTANFRKLEAASIINAHKGCGHALPGTCSPCMHGMALH